MNTQSRGQKKRLMFLGALPLLIPLLVYVAQEWNEQKSEQPPKMFRVTENVLSITTTPRETMKVATELLLRHLKTENPPYIIAACWAYAPDADGHRITNVEVQYDRRSQHLQLGKLGDSNAWSAENVSREEIEEAAQDGRLRDFNTRGW